MFKCHLQADNLIKPPDLEIIWRLELIILNSGSYLEVSENYLKVIWRSFGCYLIIRRTTGILEDETRYLFTSGGYLVVTRRTFGV